MYTYLQEIGYVCIFKPTLELPDGKVKGNVDAELVLHAMIHIQDYDKAVIVTGDGDFRCLVEYLITTEKLKTIMIPNKLKYSGLLKKREFNPYIRYVSDIKNKVKKESPQ